MKKDRKPTNPFAEFFVFLALVGALYMALEGLVYEAEIVQNLPSNADLSFGSAWNQVTQGQPQASPAARTYAK